MGFFSTGSAARAWQPIAAASASPANGSGIQPTFDAEIHGWVERQSWPGVSERTCEHRAQDHRGSR
jgi:hypothetical protein